MSQAPFRGVNQRLASRSIRVMISPTPSTFAERRSILQVLKKYGPVDVFKKENQHASRYITVTRNEDTAKTLTQLSPIACRVSLPRMENEKRARQLQSLEESTAQPKIEFKTQTTESPREEQEPQQPSRKGGADFGTREFVLTIGPARDYIHTNASNKATEYFSWPAGYTSDKSFAVMALRATLPDTLLKTGLCYWNLEPEMGNRNSMQKRLERKQQIPGQMLSQTQTTRPPSPRGIQSANSARR